MAAHGFELGQCGWLEYWVRPAKARKGKAPRLFASGQRQSTEQPLPLVFIHGLGFGVAMYARVSRWLSRAVDCDVFVLRLPHVASCPKAAPIAIEMVNRRTHERVRMQTRCRLAG